MSTRAATRRSARGVVLLLVLLIGPLLLAGSSLAVSGLISTQVESTPVAATASVAWADGSDTRPVTIQVMSDDGVGLLAPAWNGLVTDVAPIVDKKLETGTRLVQIDGVWRLASHTARPFYRIIGRGDSGWDVSMLNDLLSSLKLPAGEGSRWSDETQRGVSRLAQDLGAPSSGDTPFDPGWVVWLPNPTQEVGSVAVEVGAPAPGAGSEVVSGPPVVVAVAIEQDRSDLSGVRGAGWELVVNDDSAPYSGSPSAPVEDLSFFHPVVSGESIMMGTLRRIVPIPGFDVAPSAVVEASRPEHYCLFVAAASPAPAWRPVPIEVLGGDIGVSRIRGTIDRDAIVLLNPHEVLEDRSCG